MNDMIVITQKSFLKFHALTNYQFKTDVAFKKLKAGVAGINLM